MWDPEIEYFHEDDNTQASDPQRFPLRIEEKLPPLRVSVLKDFLASMEDVSPHEHRESMLQALNIILGHHAKSTPTTTMVGGNRAYTDDKQLTERSSLSGGIEAIRGFFLSVRLTSSLTAVNVKVSRGAFYEAIRLSDLIDRWSARQSQSDYTDESYWFRLETFLRGVKVRTNYLKDEKDNRVTKVRTIKAFASPKDGEAKALLLTSNYLRLHHNKCGFISMARGTLRSKRTNRQTPQKTVISGSTSFSRAVFLAVFSLFIFC